MAEYIKKNALLRELYSCPKLRLAHTLLEGEFIDTYDVAAALEKTGKRDSVENLIDIVRCADCKEYQAWGDGMICMRLGSYHGNTNPNDFCSRGTRKESRR